MRKPLIRAKDLRELASASLSDDARFESALIIDTRAPNTRATDMGFETVILEKIDFSGSTFPNLKLMDVKVLSSNLANSKCEKLNVLRTEFVSSRLTGIHAPESGLQDVLFQRCKIDLSLFRFSSLKDVVFDECVLSGSDFLGAKLERVTFRNCNLSESEFSQAKMKDVDLRGSKIQNIHLQKDALGGKVKVDTGQALYIASLFGLIIED